MAAETYSLELNTLLSVGQLQGKEGPIVTHVVNFMPPTKPINTVAERRRRKRRGEKKENINKTQDVTVVQKPAAFSNCFYHHLI